MYMYVTYLSFSWQLQQVIPSCRMLYSPNINQKGFLAQENRDVNPLGEVKFTRSWKKNLRSASISTHGPCGTKQSHYWLGQCQPSHEGGHLDHSMDSISIRAHAMNCDEGATSLQRLTPSCCDRHHFSIFVALMIKRDFS